MTRRIGKIDAFDPFGNPGGKGRGEPAGIRGAPGIGQGGLNAGGIVQPHGTIQRLNRCHPVKYPARGGRFPF